MTFTIHHFDQLAASPAEPLLRELDAGLLAAGYARTSCIGWADKVCAIMQGRRVIAAIAWRHIEDRRSAWITLGGTRAGYRREGHYRKCWEALLESLRVDWPEIDIVESGHHAQNAASQAMHEAFGRRLDILGYYYPLRDVSRGRISQIKRGEGWDA